MKYKQPTIRQEIEEKLIRKVKKLLPVHNPYPHSYYEKFRDEFLKELDKLLLHE